MEVSRENYDLHPFMNQLINRQDSDRQYFAIPTSSEVTVNNNTSVLTKADLFELPVNKYNFLSFVYKINNINDLEFWVNESKHTVKEKTLKRVLLLFANVYKNETLSNLNNYQNAVRVGMKLESQEAALSWIRKNVKL